MSLESNLYAVLSTVCDNVYPDFAPEDTPRPFITWEQVGGSAIKPLGKSVPNVREAMIQISVWSETRLGTSQLMLLVDSAMRTATQFAARPDAEMMSTADQETGLRGAIQDFVIRDLR
jgi:hypothetical protein